jgi:AcrR family transcriptional regulator
MASSSTPPAGLADSRDARQRAVAQLRRSHVLAAAHSAFFELGLAGASMREIAKRAGYTAGAIYSYFSNKEEIYGALLGESLERLNERVQAAQAEGGDAASSATPKTNAEAALRAKAGAFFDFYRENPRDLDLGFYLFQGMQPRGLTPDLNERLNARLRDALSPTQQELLKLGYEAKEAQAEVTALFAHIVGLLVLSHTGRIRMFRQESQVLFIRYVEAMIARAPCTGRRSKSPRKKRVVA